MFFPRTRLVRTKSMPCSKGRPKRIVNERSKRALVPNSTLAFLTVIRTHAETFASATIAISKTPRSFPLPILLLTAHVFWAAVSFGCGTPPRWPCSCCESSTSTTFAPASAAWDKMRSNSCADHASLVDDQSIARGE